MKEVSTSNFDSKILAAKGPAAVFFHAPWCKACEQMNELVIKMEQELDDVVFAAVNTDISEEIVTQQGVRTIPTLRIFKDGKLSGRIRGPISEEDFRRELSEAMGAGGA